MADQARRVLDRLFGRERNAVLARKPCHCYSLGLCPRLLLFNTKYSIGACKLDHIYVKVPQDRTRHCELELLGMLLSICKRACSAAPACRTEARGGPGRQTEAEMLSLEISHMLSSLPSSHDVIGGMAAIEAKKKRLSEINEALYASNKGLPRPRCCVCYEPMDPGSPGQKYAKHTRSPMHKIFVRMRNVIGLLALKYGIKDCSDMDAVAMADDDAL